MAILPFNTNNKTVNHPITPYIEKGSELYYVEIMILFLSSKYSALFLLSHSS